MANFRKWLFLNITFVSFVITIFLGRGWYKYLAHRGIKKYVEYGPLWYVSTYDYELFSFS